VHQHEFEEHVGIRFAGERFVGWLPAYKVTGDNLVRDRFTGEVLTMQKCVTCGEQGYVVR